MNQVINTFITGLNEIGRGFWDYAADVFIQTSLLIVLLVILDFILRKRVRAVFRYCLWMLLFIKLVLPASFTLPTGIGYWLGDYVPSEDSIEKFTPHTEDTVPMIQTDEVVPGVTNTPQKYVLDVPIMYTMNETMSSGVELESINWQGLVFSGWLVGMLVLSVSVVRRFYSVRRLIANSRPANERSVEMLDECRRRMGIRSNIELRLTGNKLSPAVCGLFKPTILMPSALLQKLSREKLKIVLIHELAHIKRYDAWVNLLQTMLQIVYFYNPLVWIANAMVRRVREQAVDEMVLVTLRAETKNYSNMLIDIAEMAFWRPNFSLSIIGVVESKKSLERRINHMLTRPVPKSSKLGLLRLIAIVVIGATLLPMGRNSRTEAAVAREYSQAHSKTNLIVPGMRVGDFTFNMNKDDLLKRLGKPNSIFIENKTYTLENLPGNYYMSFGDISFLIVDDKIKEIAALSPYYKFPNGLGVGDSEQKIEQAFGNDFHLREGNGKDYLSYEKKGLLFEISKKDKTVREIGIRPTTSDHSNYNASDQREKSDHTIVPGLRIGDYTLNMRKDDVLKKLGEPETIQLGIDSINVVRRGQEKYNLDNLPDESILSFGDISFWINKDSMEAISAHSPLYKLRNGLKVGDSEQKIKQAFGDDFSIEEFLGKNFLCYEVRGLAFGIHKENQTISEIVIYHPEGVHDAREQKEHSQQIIVPGVGVGDYTLDMSKDEVLKELGEPDAIQLGEDEVVRRGEEKYSLDNLPSEYGLSFGDISFCFKDDSLELISVRSPLYKLSNGLGVGDSQQKIKEALGEDFWPREEEGRNFFRYDAKGLGFAIGKKKQTVTEIFVYQPQAHRGDREGQREKPKVIMLSDQPPGPITFPKIDRRPKADPSEPWEIKSLPKYDPNSRSVFQVDLRDRDLSKLDLRNSIENLMYADFDDRTVWPASEKMPHGFNWQKFMELGKNPGLGVRTLHEKGITGKGVGVAIIDQPLLTEHREYADRLRLYEENNIRDRDTATMHGAAVASIAVGKTVGVAPDADLYYIATWNMSRDDDPRYNFVFRAQSIRHLLEINRQLPADRKIRVISNSIGWSPSQDGYDEITAACAEARAAGIFVVTCGIIEPYGFDFGGLGRDPLANPDSFESRGPCLDWIQIFFRSAPGRDSDTLWVPEDSRTTASPNGPDEYVFYRQGGASWCAPYIAGMYALAAQVDAGITPEKFWNLALKTGRTIQVEHEGQTRSFGPVIDPVRLIDALENK